jgi:hypothetical protein
MKRKLRKLLRRMVEFIDKRVGNNKISELPTLTQDDIDGFQRVKGGRRIKRRRSLLHKENDEE